MKWIGRILYLLVVFIVSFFVYMFSLAQKYYKFFETNMIELNETYDRERYIQTLMTDEILLTSYLKDPIYIATSEEEGRKFEFGIYQFKYESKDLTNYVSAIFFKDLGIEEMVEISQDENYINNPNLVQYKLSLYYNNDETPAIGYINSYYLNQKMFYFATIGEFEGNINYSFNQSVDGNQTTINKDLLTKIEVDLVNSLKEDVEETRILEVSHDDMHDNVGENKIIDGKATNFNGKVSYHDLKENYQKPTNEGEEDLTGILLTEELNSYRGITIRTNIIYYSILAVVTYLIYFLRPTINYFRNRKYQKTRQQNIIDAE